MTKLSLPPDETQNSSPAIRGSATSLGRALSSFGGDDDDVDAHMNAIADELDAKLAVLQAQSWSRARPQQKLRSMPTMINIDTAAVRQPFHSQQKRKPTHVTLRTRTPLFL